jgi:hypothetical protein
MAENNAAIWRYSLCDDRDFPKNLGIRKKKGVYIDYNDKERLIFHDSFSGSNLV